MKSIPLGMCAVLLGLPLVGACSLDATGTSGGIGGASSGTATSGSNNSTGSSMLTTGATMTTSSSNTGPSTTGSSMSSSSSDASGSSSGSGSVSSSSTGSGPVDYPFCAIGNGQLVDDFNGYANDMDFTQKDETNGPWMEVLAGGDRVHWQGDKIVTDYDMGQYAFLASKGAVDRTVDCALTIRAVETNEDTLGGRFLLVDQANSANTKLVGFRFQRDKIYGSGTMTEHDLANAIDASHILVLGMVLKPQQNKIVLVYDEGQGWKTLSSEDNPAWDVTLPPHIHIGEYGSGGHHHMTWDDFDKDPISTDDVP